MLLALYSGFTPTVLKLVSGEVPSGRYNADAQEAVSIRLTWAGHVLPDASHVSITCTLILSP